MSQEFTEITDNLKAEGMTAEASTLSAVNHQANVVGMYYSTLITWNIRPKDALSLTIEWMSICSEPEDDEA